MTTLESTTERLEGALRRLAVEAGDLFDELLRGGAELPFEVEPIEGRGPLPMYQYTPQTRQFIERNAAELRRLEAFVEVRELAGEEGAIGFLVGLWDGRSEFELVEDRLRGAIDAVLSATSGAAGTAAGEVIVPLIGFHMPGDELELDGVRIIRAATVEDAPAEAVEATRTGGKGRGGFLAQVSCAAAGVAPGAAVADELRRALRAMRLFRPGAVGIAAQGWVRRPEGWERFPTGANRPRHGGYRLTGNEASDLETFSRILISRGTRIPALDWAISRFDLGAERSSLIEALSDYLLALRGLLEGGGPARAALGARVAALATEGEDERSSARVAVERALALERKLMSGSRFAPAKDSRPLEVIAELEDLLRRILRGMVAGELGGDLRATADEILLADGLRAGDAAASIGETAEWSLPDATEIPDPAATETAGPAEIAGPTDFPDPGHEEEIQVSRAEDLNQGAVEASDAGGGDPSPAEVEQEQETTRIVVEDVELPRLMADETPPSEGPEPGPGQDWFSAAEGELEWPAFAKPRRDGKGKPGERETSDRVRHLFPVPDATDWDVGELPYKRKSRQAGR